MTVTSIGFILMRNAQKLSGNNMARRTINYKNPYYRPGQSMYGPPIYKRVKAQVEEYSGSSSKIQYMWSVLGMMVGGS